MELPRDAVADGSGVARARCGGVVYICHWESGCIFTNYRLSTAHLGSMVE
jgi:hypothetical protein